MPAGEEVDDPLLSENFYMEQDARQSKKRKAEGDPEADPLDSDDDDMTDPFEGFSLRSSARTRFLKKWNTDPFKAPSPKRAKKKPPPKKKPAKKK